ncbi:hypothetical protein [Pedobacter punctiformis]|uniref:Uncharacterized protein n=1 Tax=Pedobacter punctiformis TaxID=3004097 RepID=A0ABT4LA84_9SPHI|nr:hypothetical protein [Pedobacter sp. HCMS5-2]MCZ4244820.1 hypothetical protein [Pedobacter sp. HCMS5-2]
MNVLKYFNSIFLLTYGTLAIAIVFKVFHLPFTEIINSISAFLILGFIILCLFEVNSSDKFTSSEKVMWTSGLIICSVITAIIYAVNGRKKIFRNYRILKR